MSNLAAARTPFLEHDCCECGQMRRAHMLGGGIEDHAFEPVEWPRRVFGPLPIEPRDPEPSALTTFTTMASLVPNVAGGGPIGGVWTSLVTTVDPSAASTAIREMYDRAPVCKECGIGVVVGLGNHHNTCSKFDRVMAGLDAPVDEVPAIAPEVVHVSPDEESAEVDQIPADVPVLVQPSRSKRYSCGKCGALGHTARSCGRASRYAARRDFVPTKVVAPEVAAPAPAYMEPEQAEVDDQNDDQDEAEMFDRRAALRSAPAPAASRNDKFARIEAAARARNGDR